MIITNAKIVTPEKIIHGDIVVDQEGKIASIIEGHPGESAATDRIPSGNKGDSIASLQNDNHTFDAQGRYVLPGLIEVHGHMREPGLTQKEDVPHGTKAAIAGGFTTIIDMPNTKPPTTTVDRLKEKFEKIYPDRSYTDYAFFMGVAKDSLGELEKVDPKDIVGIKVFMAGHETTPTTIPDDETLDKIMVIASKRNLLLAVHAEDQNLLNEFDKELKKTGRTDPAFWSELRPKEVVIKAVERAIRLAKKHDIRLYFLHLSTREEFDMVSKAKQDLAGLEAGNLRGRSIYGELVSYQLLFNSTDYERLGNKIKVAPALRSPQDQQFLWELFRQRIPDVLCSEHTPHEWETKNQPDVWKAPAGMPNIQETLPAIITAWTKRFGNPSANSGRRETIEECLMTIAQLASYNPAKIFGFDNKGEIAVGKDADLVVIDTNNEWTVVKKDLFTKCGWSAYEGMQLIGQPSATFLRGQLLYENGKILKNPLGSWLNA